MHVKMNHKVELEISLIQAPAHILENLNYWANYSSSTLYFFAEIQF